MTAAPTTTMKTRSSTNTVPFFVLKLSEDRAKALFTVPSDMADFLVQRPILCRGASFDLEIDVVSQGRVGRRSKQAMGSKDDTNDAATSFLAAHFRSPHPEETALAISQRIYARMGSSDPGTTNSIPSLSGMLGMR